MRWNCLIFNKVLEKRRGPMNLLKRIWETIRPEKCQQCGWLVWFERKEKERRCLMCRELNQLKEQVIAEKHQCPDDGTLLVVELWWNSHIIKKCPKCDKVWCGGLILEDFLMQLSERRRIESEFGAANAALLWI